MKEYRVPDMKCEHCVKTLQEAFRKENINIETHIRRKKIYVPESVDESKVADIARKAGYTLKAIN